MTNTTQSQQLYRKAVIVITEELCESSLVPNRCTQLHCISSTCHISFQGRIPNKNTGYAWQPWWTHICIINGKYIPMIRIHTTPHIHSWISVEPSSTFLCDWAQAWALSLSVTGCNQVCYHLRTFHLFPEPELCMKTFFFFFFFLCSLWWGDNHWMWQKVFRLKNHLPF